jgi:D-glycero-alpha-D-manno-heptose-7-phosphate kinase
MIIAKTPLRISYVGGGSDISSYYREHGGAVISSAIKKYVYIVVKPRFEKGIRLSYSKTENVEFINDLKHPLVKNGLKMMALKDGLEIVSMADIPSSGTGLGSSSSFSVGLFNALAAYDGKLLTTNKLAELACELEIEKCLSPIGKQDQYAAAYGGLRVYKFNQDDTVTEEIIACNSETISKINNETIGFYIGGNRDANAILSQQSKDLTDSHKIKKMNAMVSLVWDLKKEFESQSTDNFGKILHENWILKRELSSGISSGYIDEIYSEARSVGASGGKLLGAGGGGFMIFHAPTSEIKEKICQKLHKLKRVSMCIDQQGSSIILNQ